MGRIESFVTASAPVDFAFAYTAEYGNLPKWMLGISQIEAVTEQTRGVGALFDTEVDLGPKKLPLRLEVVEWVEGKTLGFRAANKIPGIVGTMSTWRFEELSDGGTQITATCEWETRGLAGKVMDKLLQAFGGLAIGHVKKHLRDEIDRSYASSDAST